MPDVAALAAASLFAAGINALTFGAFGRDANRHAAGRPRLRESDLLFAVALGGVVAGWLALGYFEKVPRRRFFRIKLRVAGAIGGLVLAVMLRFALFWSPS